MRSIARVSVFAATTLWAATAACSAQTAAPASPAPTVAAPAVAAPAAPAALSPTGLGAIKFGMTLAEASQAGVTLVTTYIDSGPGCYHVRQAGVPGLTYMLSEGKIVRADVVPPSTIKTADGFGLGSDRAAIVAFYSATPGGVTESPLAVGSDVSVLASPAFSKGDDVPRIVYEVGATGVKAIHAGTVQHHFGGCNALPPMQTP